MAYILSSNQGLTGPEAHLENDEMNQMTSTHRNCSPDRLRPSAVLLNHGGSHNTGSLWMGGEETCVFLT